MQSRLAQQPRTAARAATLGSGALGLDDPTRSPECFRISPLFPSHNKDSRFAPGMRRFKRLSGGAGEWCNSSSPAFALSSPVSSSCLHDVSLALAKVTTPQSSSRRRHPHRISPRIIPGFPARLLCIRCKPRLVPRVTHADQSPLQAWRNLEMAAGPSCLQGCPKFAFRLQLVGYCGGGMATASAHNRTPRDNDACGRHQCASPQCGLCRVSHIDVVVASGRTTHAVPAL